MRTKTLLCAAVLAAGVATSMAQSNVYSLNVVGYVNYSFSSGNYVLVNNPLEQATNDLNHLIPSPPNGSSVQLWNVSLQDFDPVIPSYSVAQQRWNPNVTIAAGKSFFVVANGNFTNTFVGEVRQGPWTNSLVGSGNYEAIGSTVPIGGFITNVLAQYPAVNGDSIQIWNVGLQDFDPSIPSYSAAQQKWNPDHSFAVGEGFFLVRNAGAVNYVRSFTVQ